MAPTYQQLGALPFEQTSEPFSAPLAVATTKQQGDGTGALVTAPVGSGASGVTLSRLASGDFALVSGGTTLATFSAADVQYQSGSSHILHNPAVPDPLDPTVTLDLFRIARDASNPLDPMATPRLLDYAAWGGWGFDQGGEKSYQAFAFGAPTQAGDLPTAGSLTFEGRFAGREFGPSADYNSGMNQFGHLTATAYFDANPHISGTMTGNWTGDVVLSTATFDVPITATGFTGTLTSATGATGTITGAFYGPQGAEIAGTYTLELGGTRSSSGSFGAAQP